MRRKKRRKGEGREKWVGPGKKEKEKKEKKEGKRGEEKGKRKRKKRKGKKMRSWVFSFKVLKIKFYLF